MGKDKINTKPKRVNITELSTFSDLVIKDNEDSCLKQLGVDSFTQYKKRPRQCTECACTDIVGLQVLGAFNGVLFWICNSCDHLYLKYAKSKTEKLLEKSKAFWTNPEDWTPPEKEDYN